MTARAYQPGQHPDLPPPKGMSGPLVWLRANLFSSWLNTGLTLAALALLAGAIPAVIQWAVLAADVDGTSRQDCDTAGACWAVIAERWRLFVFGFFPQDEIWRPALAMALLPIAAVPLLYAELPHRRVLMWGTIAYPVLAAWLLGGGLGLPEIEMRQWTGFVLTLVIGVTGIAASLPIGILLALGRQSDLPVVRTVCIAFIETVRGVPLITVLFFSSVMLPLFLPDGVSLDKLVRALIVVALFASAYMAEVIRGGLQAIPAGQIEAARALGLGYWRTMGLVVLPQALRISIPGIVNTFIGLFKDTSLVTTIGLLDLVGMADATLTDQNWLGLRMEVYLFVALIFWVVCFSMSRYSVWLEGRLDRDPAAARGGP